jgi:hypothetical protein
LERKSGAHRVQVLLLDADGGTTAAPIPTWSSTEQPDPIPPKPPGKDGWLAQLLGLLEKIFG